MLELNKLQEKCDRLEQDVIVLSFVCGITGGATSILLFLIYVLPTWSK